MIYRFGDCELDLESSELRCSGAVKRVEPQVFRLLHFMIENRDRVLSRDDLIDGVWNGRIVSDAAIGTRINAVRRAVGDDGRRQAIVQTLPKRGFRFVADVSVAESPRSDVGHGGMSVAVLPFRLLSSDRDASYLCEGIAQQLISALGSVRWLFVVDPVVSLSEKIGRAPTTDLAATLGVSHVINGSLQIVARKLRIIVRLVRTCDGAQVWSTSVTGDLGDLFELQDEMAREALVAVEPRLKDTAIRKSQAKHKNLSAFDHYMRAVGAMRTMQSERSDSALRDLHLALKFNPDHAAAHAMLAWLGTLRLPRGQSVDLAAATEHATKAVTLDPFDSEALAYGGYAYGFLTRRLTAGLEHIERSVRLNSNSARAYDHRGWLQLYLGRVDDARDNFELALRLAPLDEFTFRTLTGRAFSSLFRHEFEDALAFARRANVACPSFTVCHRVLAASLAHSGRESEAKEVIAELLAYHPDLTVERYRMETRFSEPTANALLMDGLRKAGLPD